MTLTERGHQNVFVFFTLFISNMNKTPAYIKSRKHKTAARTAPSASLVATAAAIAALGLPTAHAQTTAETTLPEISVTSDAAPKFKPEQVSSPKFTQKLVDTTQTINVIKSEVFKDQGATTLTEALRNVAGVGTFSIGENGRMNTGDSVRMRGFDTSNSIFLDGVRDLGNISHDVFNIEQVEVFKGPAGPDNGRSAASGSINLVTKQAHLDDAFSASVGVGSSKYKRVTVDWNKPLEGMEGAAVRLNLVGEDSGVPGRDTVENKKWGFAPSLALGLGTDTRIFLNYLHLEQSNLPDGGVPVVGLKGFSGTPAYLQSHRVKSSNFYGTKDDHDDADVDMFTVRLEHDITADTKIQNTLRWGHKQQKMVTIRPGNITATNPDVSQWVIARGGNSVDQRDKLLVNQTNLNTKFKTAGIEHSVSTGLELSQEDSKSYTLTPFVFTPTTTNLWHPNPNVGSYEPLTRTGAYDTKKVDTISLYAFDTLKFNEQWQVNGGVRADHFDIGYKGRAVTGVATERNHSDTLVNWKLGALFKPAPNGSIYANYAIQQQPPGTVVSGDGAGGGIVIPAAPSTDPSAPGNNINDLSRDPQKTKTVELGTKWELLDQRLLLSAAWFHSEASNELYCEVTAAIPPATGNVTNCTQDGKKTVKGLELGAIGQLTKDWQVTAGLVLQRGKGDLKAAAATAAADGSTDLPFIPETAFTLWSTYKVDNNLSVGGGASYTSKIKKSKDGNATGPKEIQSYWVASAMASYKVNKNVSLRFNVDNLFDKFYVASINRGGNRYFPGAERTYRLTANFDF